MSDVYSASPDVVPGSGGQPTRITVRPVDPLAGLPEWTPAEEAGSAQAARNAAAARTAGQRHPTNELPDWEPPKAKEPPSREVGTGEAAALGLEHGLSAGTAPALHGLSEAAKPTLQTYAEQQGVDPAKLEAVTPPHVKAVMGAADLLTQWATGHPDPTVREAYERGRQHARENEQLAQDQHAAAYNAGVLTGAVAAPLPMSGVRAAGALGRLGQGARIGAIGGGTFGAGEQIGEGAGASDVLKGGAKGAAIGAAIGAPLVAAVGPRVVNAGSPGQRAAATAEGLGAPIPRGLASDNPTINATTSKIRSVPVLGSRVSSAVDRTQEAAGEAVGDLSAHLGGAERSVAGAQITPALEGVVTANNRTADANYNGLRNLLDPSRRFRMPRTAQVLDAIAASRRAAGWPNPEVGLEQFRNVSNDATFNGANRARTDARNAGNVTAANPGYNAADFNQITRAMTADLRAIVQASARNATPAGRQAALAAFDRAETQFGQIAEQNRVLQRLINAGGESTIATLLKAGKEKGGNLQLLAQLRNAMAPADFQMLAGTAIYDLGLNPSTQQFSLAKFATEWGKISDGAKRVMFAPDHLQALDDIAQLGMHIKGALRESNTSHTAGVLILLDMARDATMLGIGLGTGAITAGSAVGGAVAAAPSLLLAHWLSSPAHVNAIGAWTRSYRALTLSQPTPARQAAFRLATRNLANTLGIPLDRLTNTIVTRASQEDQPGDLQQK